MSERREPGRPKAVATLLGVDSTSDVGGGADSPERIPREARSEVVGNDVGVPPGERSPLWR
jgi:hypothetical protein